MRMRTWVTATNTVNMAAKVDQAARWLGDTLLLDSDAYILLCGIIIPSLPTLSYLRCSCSLSYYLTLANGETYSPDKL